MSELGAVFGRASETASFSFRGLSFLEGIFPTLPILNLVEMMAERGKVDWAA
jgi:hypothetical protein